MAARPYKQDYLNWLCDLAGIERLRLGRGGSVPKAVFEAFGPVFEDSVNGSMPATAQRMVESVELPWEAHFDSRNSPSGGGSTVSKDGLKQLLKAAEMVLPDDLGTFVRATRSDRNIGEQYRMAVEAGMDTNTSRTLEWSSTATAHQEHASTQNRLADVLRERGVSPISPRPQDPQFDIAWIAGDRLTIAEVKSIRPVNMVQQVRLGIGQVLHYAHQIAVRTQKGPPATVLVPSQAITRDLWEYCRSLDIAVAVPNDFETVLAGQEP